MQLIKQEKGPGWSFTFIVLHVNK